ncbi:MAG: hypothetical protein GY838_13250 [bacterium]|nr:hypothetical protein [bacterium]
MKRNAQLLAILLLATLGLGAEGQCNACENTEASKCLDYSGDASALAVYEDEETLTFQFGANLDSVCAHVMLHNPTDNTARASTDCEFHLDDWHAGDNSIEDVVVCPNSTVESTICFNDDFDEFTEVSTVCITVWR